MSTNAVDCRSGKQTGLRCAANKPVYVVSLVLVCMGIYIYMYVCMYAYVCRSCMYVRLYSI